MKVAVICEFSGIVRDAFLECGHYAISFDLLPSESSRGPHVEGDVFSVGRDYFSTFDLAVCHPPCTHLAVSGARWFDQKREEQEAALDFVRWLMHLPVKRIAVENPISIISTRIRKPDQIVQPWQFGHGETKATCFWLKNLPKLVPTNVVIGRENRVHRLPERPDRWKDRSRTYQGIAAAMAQQWGGLV